MVSGGPGQGHHWEAAGGNDHGRGRSSGHHQGLERGQGGRDPSVQGRGREPREGEGQPPRKVQKNDDLERAMEKEMVDALKKQNEELKAMLDRLLEEKKNEKKDKQQKAAEVPWVAMTPDARPPERRQTPGGTMVPPNTPPDRAATNAGLAICNTTEEP